MQNIYCIIKMSPKLRRGELNHALHDTWKFDFTDCVT